MHKGMNGVKFSLYAQRQYLPFYAKVYMTTAVVYYIKGLLKSRYHYAICGMYCNTMFIASVSFCCYSGHDWIPPSSLFCS